MKTNLGSVFSFLMALSGLDFGPASLHADITEAWVHRYSNVVSNSVDQAFKVLTDSAGDVIVTGVSDDGISGPDILTIKYSGSDGSKVWQQRYSGLANAIEAVTGVATDASGNVVILGTSALEGPEGLTYKGEYYLARYASSDGVILWEKHIPGAIPSYWGGVYRPAFLGLDRRGDVIVSMPHREDGNGDLKTGKYAAEGGALLWETFHSNHSRGYDLPANIAIDGSGNVLAVGIFSGDEGLSERYLIKYSPEGLLLWEKRSSNLPDTYYATPKAIAVDGSGDVLVVENVNKGGNLDCVTTKYAAADGTILWTKLYNGAANGDESPLALVLDSIGNVLVTGSSSVDDFYTIKYAGADGAVLWEKIRNSSGGSNNPQAIAVDSSGNVIETGTFDYDFYTAKYGAQDGALLWEKRYSGPGKYDSGDYPVAVALDSNGNVLVTGNSDNAFYTAKYAAFDGALSWEQRHHGPANRDDWPIAMAIDAHGNIIVTGSSWKDDGVDLYPIEYYTAKYAVADGSLLWSQHHSASDRSQAVAVDTDGNVVITGSSYSDGPSRWIGYTAKYRAEDGVLLWEHRSDELGHSSEILAVAIDGTGNIVITGSVYQSGPRSNTDYYTAKYAAADGTLLWERLYSGPAGLDDRALAVALDLEGNVFVTGQSASSELLFNSVNDFYTAKYAAADGALLWEQRYNGPTNGDDQAAAIAVDGSGNVVVTGRSSIGLSNGWFQYDSYTAKYAAIDGSLLWEKSHDTLSVTYGEGNGVAVDSFDNVVVTGYSNGYYTAKYAGASGLLLWEKRGQAGVSRAVRITSSGNVVVAGEIGNSHGNLDYYMAGYGLADGALLWEKQYNGPANGEDYFTGLAIGPGGIVAITGASDGGFYSDNFFDYATIVYREALPPLAVELLPDGVRLLFTGISGLSYKLERAPSVTGPWSVIDTQTARESGLLEYLDTIPHPGSGFYRTREP